MDDGSGPGLMSLSPTAIINPLITCVAVVSYLVVSFTQELESLGSLVHEDAVQVAGLYRADLDGLLSPSHNLVGPNVSCKEREKLKLKIKLN